MNKKDEALKQLDNLKKDFERQSQELKKIIEDSDKPKTIFERVYDVQSAINELGEAHPEVKEYRILQKAGTSLKTLQGQEITIFCAAMNEGTKLSWKDANQEKNYIWFDFKYNFDSPSFVSDVCCRCYLSFSVSSRHAYSSRKKAEHGAKCLKQLYYDFLTD